LDTLSKKPANPVTTTVVERLKVVVDKIVILGQNQKEKKIHNEVNS
jgi:hypothetical protein